MKAAEVSLEGDHPPVFTDMLKAAKKTPYGEPRIALPQRALAIKRLRKGNEDQLVVHDVATLGTDIEDIMDAIALIGQQQATLIVWTPEPQEYEWHPDAADIVALAAAGAAMIKSEKHRRAAQKHLGSPPKLIGRVRDAALLAWADPSLTAAQAAARVEEVTGTKVSARLLFDKLGHKSAAETTLALPKLSGPVPTVANKPPAKRKTKPKRSKAKRPARRVTKGTAHAN